MRGGAQDEGYLQSGRARVNGMEGRRWDGRERCYEHVGALENSRRRARRGPCAFRSSTTSTTSTTSERRLAIFVPGPHRSGTAPAALMWKRHAACLRSGSFALASPRRRWRAQGLRDAIASSQSVLRRYARAHDAPSTADGAIGDDEFLHALRQVLPPDQLQPDSPPLGLAVSGGVDSMAVATLYARCRQSHPLPGLHAIIVDHQARPGSAQEAQWVADQLSIRTTCTQLAPSNPR